jgi:hypothetical protein
MQAVSQNLSPNIFHRAAPWHQCQQSHLSSQGDVPRTYPCTVLCAKQYPPETPMPIGFRHVLHSIPQIVVFFALYKMALQLMLELVWTRFALYKYILPYRVSERITRDGEAALSVLGIPSIPVSVLPLLSGVSLVEV